MNLTNAQGLAAAIAEVLNRQDLISTIPSWIAMAESGFNQTLRLRPMIRRQHSVFNGAFGMLPPDFLEMKSVSTTYLGRTHKLFYGSEEDLDDLQRFHLFPTHPTHFAIIGQEMEIGPVSPTGEWDIAMTYYSPIPSLNTADPTSTNWLLQKSSQLYLYASLLHSAPYLVEDDRIPVWQGYAAAAIQSLQAEDEASTHAGSQLRQRIRPIG